MEKIYHFSQKEWGTKGRSAWTSTCMVKKLPAVGYYIARKYAQFYYDTESFGCEWYDNTLRKDKEVQSFLKNGIFLILGKYELEPIDSSYYCMIVQRVPKEKVEAIVQEIYDFLEQFKEKFV